MALHVSELDEFAVDELNKAFTDEASLPASYDSIMWTGFKEDRGTVDIFGQIIARPKGWRTHEAPRSLWKFSVVCMFCHDIGGDYLRGMRFPKHPDHGRDGKFPFDCDPENIEKLVRESMRKAIEKLVVLMKEEPAKT